MEVIIDTNFLLACLKQKIDLFYELDRILSYYQIVIPKRVINEIETLKNRKELSVKERDSASLALQILEKNKEKIKFLDLAGSVDKAIVNYTLNNKDVVMASLDGGMKKHVKGKAKILTIRKRKTLSLI